MATFEEFYGALDPDPGIRGKQFERFAKWFLQTDPEWSSQIERIWLWNEYPDRWGPDRGIDLVFRHRNGGIWAVQAKCISPDHTITKAEIDSFLSESSDARVQGRLLIATTDGLGRNARATIARQEKQVVCYLLEQFRHSSVEFPRSAKALRTGKPRQRPKPRPHQQAAIRDVLKGFKSAKRGQLIMACGTGKTLTSLWIRERLQAKRTLVLVPSLNLLSQTLREWTTATSKSFDWLCVCSDSSVARKEDEWVSSIIDIGVPVTRDSTEIAHFLRRRKPLVVFSTYQSSPLIAEAQSESRVPRLDIAFADEAHRCAGKVSEAFGCILDDARIRVDKRLFMTATPRVLSKHVISKAEGRDIEVASMDNRDVFGDVLHSLNFSAAIEKDLLSDYRVVVVGVDDPMIRKKIRDRSLIRTSNGIELDAEILGAHIGLAKCVNDFDLHRLITFHSRVKGAREFSSDHEQILDWLPEKDKAKGPLTADYVSGEMNTSDRNKKLNRLRNLMQGERAMLANARCLSEGVDVPALDGVAFINPRKSPVDIVQAVGRAIRKSENKTHGTIVIPVFIADHEDAEVALDQSSFKPVWDVVNALRSHDDELAQELDSFRTILGKRRGSGADVGRLEKIVIDLPESAESNFVSALKTRLVEQATTSWFFWYGMLIEYSEREGHATPPGLFRTEEGHRLGSWVNSQRTKRELISTAEIEMLEALPGWTWDARASRWDKGYKHLRSFVAKHGHARPASSFKTIGGFSLGGWVVRQRVRMGSLSVNQIKKLEALPRWEWDPFEEQWENGYEELKAYARREGHARVPQNFHSSDGFALGSWVAVRRRSRDSLSKNRVNLLESLPGWMWDTRAEKWNDGYWRLRAFVKEHGHARVAQGFKTGDGFALGTWVVGQRRRKDSLSSEQVKQLEALPSWAWDPFAERWEENFMQLMAYVRQEGHARPAVTFVTSDGFSLGIWVATQRSNKHKLDKKRFELLEGLKGWSWEPHTDQWQESFEQLKTYAQREGHSRPPALFKTSDGFRLGAWVRAQREYRDSLSEERASLLEALPGWAWDVADAEWGKAYVRLMVFADRVGHARPDASYKSKDGFPLGRWVSKQRGNKDSLDENRVKQLEALAGWAWNAQEERWNTAFDQLKAYVRQEGHARPPGLFKTSDGFPLGRWVSKRRSKKESLSVERVKQLEALPGWTWQIRKKG